MNHLLRLACAFLFLFCFSLPLSASADSSEKTQSTAVKNSVTSAAKNTRKASSQEAKSAAASTSKDNGDKEFWLKRAQKSEIYTGKASWYGRDFHNKKTASGLAYDMYTFTAAHRTLPLGTVVKVTDQHNGKSVMVCITDRGPYVHGRIIDVSYAAAKQLDLEERGVGKVALEVVSDEKGSPLKAGHAYFVKYNSDNGKKKVGPYNAYADAAAMHEAIRQAHPEAEVVLENSDK